MCILNLCIISNAVFLFVVSCLQNSIGLTIWQRISKEFFGKLYPTESAPVAPTKPSNKHFMTTHKSSASDSNNNDYGDDDLNDETMETTTATKRYRHVTLTRGLSKYGPWGYLILGMLLCGGALLLCVLWGKNLSVHAHKTNSIFLSLINPYQDSRYL